MSACAKCRFYKTPIVRMEYRIKEAFGYLDPVTYSDRGECRRHSPDKDGWHVVFAGEWCGDFEPAEDTKP